MNPRYFVTYKNLKTAQSAPVEVSFGRFYDLDAAERRAKEAYDVEGYGELISVRPETEAEARMYRVSRFFIRGFRIASGACLALFAFAWLSNSGSGIGGVPLSDLTLNLILSGLFKVALYIAAACLCWYIAFGDGPEH